MQVIIVTNAMEPWVETSCRSLLHGLTENLFDMSFFGGWVWGPRSLQAPIMWILKQQMCCSQLVDLLFLAPGRFFLFCQEFPPSLGANCFADPSHLRCFSAFGIKGWRLKWVIKSIWVSPQFFRWPCWDGYVSDRFKGCLYKWPPNFRGWKGLHLRTTWWFSGCIFCRSHRGQIGFWHNDLWCCQGVVLGTLWKHLRFVKDFDAFVGKSASKDSD